MIKKLLFINRRLSVGGSERVMTLLANEIASRGISVDMVVLQDYGKTYTVSDQVQLFEFEHKCKFKIMKSIDRLRKLRKIITQGDYDAIISFMDIVNFYTIIAGFGNKKIIISERNDPSQIKNFVIRIGRKALYPFVAKIVFQTEAAKSFFSPKIQKKGEIIINPVSSNVPHLYEGERKKNIVAVGRFVEQKNFKMAIDAFKILHNDYKDYKLIIYGEGQLEKEIKDYTNKMGLENAVLFPGFVSDVLERICDAKMYISSSNFEGISNAMLEALAIGLPVVVTDCPVGGAKAVIKNNINGILIKVGDTKALYKSMKKIIEDKEFANMLSQNAIKIKEEYSVKNIADKWLNLVDSIEK